MITLYNDRLVLNDHNDKPFTKMNKGKVKEMYYSSHFNSLIVFEPVDKEVDDIGDIINALPKEYFNWLENKLLTEFKLIVHWTQAAWTTSDFDIYYDLNPSELELTKFKSVKNVLKEYNSNPISYKYTEIKNRVATKIDFIGMGIFLDETIWFG